MQELIRVRRVHEPGERLVLHRYPLPVRLTHWINVLCLSVLLSSGQIFNAHPALYG
jgi:Ni,Fe-hydrogenase I cytochrome b subunit